MMGREGGRRVRVMRIHARWPDDANRPARLGRLRLVVGRSVVDRIGQGPLGQRPCAQAEAGGRRAHRRRLGRRSGAGARRTRPRWESRLVGAAPARVDVVAAVGSSCGVALLRRGFGREGVRGRIQRDRLCRRPSARGGPGRRRDVRFGWCELSRRIAAATRRHLRGRARVARDRVSRWRRRGGWASSRCGGACAALVRGVGGVGLRLPSQRPDLFLVA